jgi:uncharacterized protein (DUF2164 family)
MDRQNWLKDYRRNKEATWIRCKLTNDEEINCENFSEWIDLKSKCEKENLFFKKFILQYRSHQEEVDVKDIDALYLIRSIKGRMGGEDQHSYTVGTIKDNKVDKKMWLIPELIVDIEYEDKVENCFEEAIIYDKTKAN